MITSTTNRQIKDIAALLSRAKERKKQGLFVVEGHRMVCETPGHLLEKIYVSESCLAEHRDASIFEEADCDVLSDAVYRHISDTRTPQGIMAIVKMPSYGIFDIIPDNNSHILMLEGIQDPGNLGTMIRTAEGAGISSIIMDKNTVDVFNPKTIRSTMGSIYRMPFVVADDITQAIADVKRNGIKVYAAHLLGSVPYDEPDYRNGAAFLIGNEGNGLSRDAYEAADVKIRIPMDGSVESLNAAVSAAVIMYEARRQKGMR